VTLKTLQKWMNHPAYMAVCFLVGVIAWSFSFESVRQVTEVTRRPASLQLSELASRADLRDEVSATEYRELQQISDKEMIIKLEKVRPQWNKPQGPFTVSLAQVDAFNERKVKRLPKRFAGNPVFQLLQKVGSDTATTDYEDLLVCDKSRMFYENRIGIYPVLNDLIKERTPASENFSRECVISSMRQFQVPKLNFASCAHSEMGAPQTPGGKPCVTPALVNLTYNAYVDALECLNLNPKHMMAKIDFESGFFLNSFGVNKESGVGQLTEVAVQEVNRHYDSYLAEIEKAASTKPSCANLIKNKSLLSMAPAGPEQRCSLIGLPENPLRNVFYMALLSRINMDTISGIKYVAGQDVLPSGEALLPLQNNQNDHFTGLYKTYRIKERLEANNIRSANPHVFKEMLGTLGYHVGVETAVKLLSQYLDERKKHELSLTSEDFNFQSRIQAPDVDGQLKDAVEVAAMYVLSSVVNSKDTAEEKKLKAKRRKELPKKWAKAYQESFPVYLAYKANSYDGKSLLPFALYGYPGYLSVIANRQSEIQDQFQNADLDPNTCTDPEFLKGL